MMTQGMTKQAVDLPTNSEPQLADELEAAIARLTPNLAAIARASLERWTPATWDEFLAIAGEQEPDGLPHLKAYYCLSHIKLQMIPLGKDHGRLNNAPLDIVSLFAAFQGLKIVRYINTTLRKSGERECQPDLSIYVGDVPCLPSPGNEVIDLDVADPPTLVVEIAASSLADDLGMKRYLYERLGVREYWIISAATRSLLAFSIDEAGRSGVITQSEVLPGLDLAIVDEALRRTDENDDAAITRWLIEMFQR
jgi:Uma2 family endonuclease